MSYIINKTDGSVLVEVVDGTINQTATDLTLIGKNASAYGEFINENLVHVLENFANSNSPPNPIIGQIWYDTSEGRLKVYDGASFKVSGGTIVSGTIPTTLTQGDIWIDSVNQQIHFYDGESRILAGPIYTQAQGISGFSIEDVYDNYQIVHTVAKLYVSQVLIGLYSKDEFIPATSIPGFSPPGSTGVVKVGFNIGLTGGKLNATSTSAESLIAEDGTLRTVESFLSSYEDSYANGTLIIQNSVPLSLGPIQNIEFNITTGIVRLNSNIINQNFSINLLNGTGLKPTMFANANTEFVGIYTDSPTATLDVNGNTRIRGNLTVEGNTTTINTTNIAIEDLVVEIGKIDNPSNTTANGGGISLQAGVDGNKTWTWQSSSNAWSSSENINLVSGKSYRINGIEVLTSNTLTTAITSAPGLSSIGDLISLNVASLSVTHSYATNNSLISYVNSSAINGSIVLVPKGTGTVDVSNSIISNVSNPVDGTDAANYQTVSSEVRTKSIAFYADTTGLTEGEVGTLILDVVYPSTDFDDSTVCRIYCVDSAILPAGYVIRQYTMTNGFWAFTQDLT